MKPLVIRLSVALSLVAIVLALVMKWATWQEGALAAVVLLLVSIVVTLRSRRQQARPD